VLTAVQLLERDAALSADVRDQLSMIRRNVELEARLIDDLLDLNRVSHGKLQLQLGSPDVHEKLKSVLQICDSDARAKGVRLTTRFTAPRRHVRGDAARLQQVFWNLIKNAIKFTPEGGHVEVETRCDRCGEGDDASERLVVSVRDTGVGIEPAVLPRVFDAFVQGGDGAINRTFGGLGLGLAITRALVELHGGAITAASEGTDRGARFEVALPLVAVPADDAQSAPATGTAPQRRAASAVVAGEFAGARILLVEDDEDSAKVLARLLRRSGAAVKTADSVAQGLQVALADPHDLLISDIGLPDGSGLDLMRQLIAARRDPAADAPHSNGNGAGGVYPAIALSGFGMEEDIRLSREAGFAEHLTKPVNLDQLHDAIRRVLAAGAGRGV
jgi:CheY-like chemotaxis protein